MEVNTKLVRSFNTSKINDLLYVNEYYKLIFATKMLNDDRGY